MSDSTALFVIQELLGVIAVLLGWMMWIVRGWTVELRAEQKEQWKWINRNRVNIARLGSNAGVDVGSD